MNIRPALVDGNEGQMGLLLIAARPFAFTLQMWYVVNEKELEKEGLSTWSVQWGTG
jgi:hypothetical protein